MYSLVNLFCLPFLDCHSLVLSVSMPSYLKRNGNMATSILGVFKTCSYLTVYSCQCNDIVSQTIITLGKLIRCFRFICFSVQKEIFPI